jgi:hypothetical protein
LDSEIDNDTVVARWNGFGELLRSKSRSLASLFPELEFCGVRKSTMYLAVPTKADKELLLQLKSEMTSALREYFGQPMQFDVGPKEDMRLKAGSPVVRNPEVVAQVAANARASASTERTELEMALMTELGAQEV